MLFVSVISIFVLLSVDQIAKLLTVNILHYMKKGHYSIFSLTYIQIIGGQVLSNNTNLLIVISVPIIAMLGWLMLKSKILTWPGILLCRCIGKPSRSNKDWLCS